jgi:hypothetical protein
MSLLLFARFCIELKLGEDMNIRCSGFLPKEDCLR